MTTPIARRIAQSIAASGPISIAQYMTMALLDPEYGYYATRDPLGTGGDFTTAPEVSQMFGELLGLWCVQAWFDQGRPTPVRLVELGPGRGTLMVDALRAMRVAPAFLAELDVVLVEASPTLRKVQQTTLAEHKVPIAWATAFESRHIDRALFLLANEFFDALPIRQFVKTEPGWRERMVALDGQGALAFALSPVPAEQMIPAGRRDAPLGGVVEISPAATALTQDIAHAIANHGGGAIIVDYGYDAPGFGETLQAVAGHRFAEVLSKPGESDLSAHVDFLALAQAAAQGGAKAYGPKEQGALLRDLGIVERAERLGMGPDSPVGLALSRLVEADKMGTLFKALAIVPQSAPTPPGF